MKTRQKNEAGFGVVAVLVLVAVVALIGTIGWLVVHNNLQKATVPAVATHTSTSPNTAVPQVEQKYLDIGEWGVRIPYSGDDTLSYRTATPYGYVSIISKELADKYPECSAYGAGQIRRLAASDPAYTLDDSMTAEEYAQKNPGAYVHVGDYYYQWFHDQSPCSGSNVADQQNITNYQNRENEFVKSLVPNLQLLPK